MDSDRTTHAIEFALNADEMVSFATLNLRRSPGYQYARSARIVLISVAVLLLVGAWLFYTRAYVFLAAAFAIVAMLSVWIAYLITEARFVRMQRAVSSRADAVPQRLVIGPATLVDEWRADQAPREHPWSEFHDLRENDLVVALYLTAPGSSVDEAIVLPRRVVSAELREMLERRAGKPFAV